MEKVNPLFEFARDVATFEREESLESSNGGKTPVSVAKILTRLSSLPSNRKCADCRMQMMDASQIFVSYSPTLGKLKQENKRSEIREFQLNHKAFAPAIESNILDKRATDPADFACLALGGHGVFICKTCSEAHQALSENVTIVKPLNDFSSWQFEEVQYLNTCGCNSTSWSVHEGFIPEEWLKRKPTHSSAMKDRLLFCRAKYEALAFVTPPGGIFAERAWSKLLQRDKALDRYLTTGHLTSFSKVSLDAYSSKASLSLTSDSLTSELEMPDRFVDFFCVVGHVKELYPGEAQKDLYAIDSPEGLSLNSTVNDCYPPQDTHSDMEFPKHISQFVFPDGCHASEMQKPPQLFTFVLTSSNGHRLYGAALKVYDETMEIGQMKEVMEASGYTVPLPWWLNDTRIPPKTKDGQPSRQPNDIIFLPKCLVVISHYPFFHAFRDFLKQLHLMSISETPLPIERYIANFTSELPLPPQGKVEVKFGFTSDVQCIISRPAPNKLPLAKFSFRPIFSCLSVSNIMVVAGLLMEETKVAILSKHYSLLTPCAEALLSFLFPLEWNGVYIPIMPHTTLDILDAPVPFLVGLHSQYLTNVQARYRPPGVVFVDLDKDIVHLGYDESESFGSQGSKKLPPSIPEKDAAKLKLKLQKFAASAYLMPANGMKGTITHGDGQLLQSSMQEPYVEQELQHTDATSESNRLDILEQSENAYPESQFLEPIQGFHSEEGQLSHKTGIDLPDTVERKPKRISNIIAKRRQKNQSRSASYGSNSSLHEVEECVDGFSVPEIRNAFLRFFTSLLNNYHEFANEDFTGDLFRTEDFLAERNYTPTKREWVERVLKTQMFQRFLEERAEDPNGATVLFFDESIAAKNNRSAKTSIKRGKKTTPFLDDLSWKIVDSFTPPAPSNWGLPADGRLYSYSQFPILDHSLFGTIRARKKWPVEWEQKIQRREGGNQKSVRRRTDALKSTLKSSGREIIQAVLGSAQVVEIATLDSSKSVGYGDRSLRWALETLADPSIVKKLRSSIGECKDQADGSPMHDGPILLAQDTILASRRKQGILLRRLVNFQLELQNWLRKREELENFVTDEDNVQKIVLIQSTCRAFLAANRWKKQRAAVSLLQNQRRANVARRAFVNKIRAALMVQACYRGQSARFAFCLVRDEVVKIQAVARRFLTMKLFLRLLQRQCLDYKNHIFLLWKRAFTPLSYRSQMWPLFRTSYLGHRLLSDEAQRMREDLGIERAISEHLFADDKVICDVAGSAIEIMDARQSSFRKGDISFPEESSDRVRQSAKRLKTEKLQVYEKLESLKDSPNLENAYNLFGIFKTEKKKKARLLEQLWDAVDLADVSANFMWMLFPELVEGGDINQVKPGKKGRSRFHEQKRVVLNPLQKDLWVNQKMDQLYRKNMSEVALASMKKMPDLHIKLYRAKLREKTTWKGRKIESMITVLSLEDWKKHKLTLMQNFLQGAV